MKQASAPPLLLQRLTQRQQQILGLMARGWDNQRIADELFISLSTVQFHVSNILAKLHVRKRTEAATFALRNNLASPARGLAEGRA